MSDLTTRSFSAILLIKPSSLGDIVHALPVWNGLRTRFPQARIDWLVNTTFVPLLEPCRIAGELIPFDRARFAGVARNLRAAGEFFRFVRALRASRYDLAIDLQGLFRSGFLARASGAGVRIGFRAAREGAWMFYNRFIPDGDLHAVDRNFAVSRLLGFDKLPVRFPLPVSDKARAAARSFLQGPDGRAEARFLAVVPGARWETKQWSVERFAETIDLLHEQTDRRCVLLGTTGEAPRCNRIADRCRTVPGNLAGRTSLTEFSALISMADLVLCHDSAAAHLAVAHGRPLVCLTGPTSPQRTGPYGRIEDVVRLDLDCSPCYLRTIRRCPHDHRCMRDLDVSTVVRAVERALALTACPTI